MLHDLYQPPSRDRRRLGLVALVAAVIAGGVLATALASGGGGRGTRTGAGAPGAPQAAKGSPARKTPPAPSNASASTGSRGQAGTVAPGSVAAGASSAATTPTRAVQSFYEDAARHDYASAWRLADANLRSQLAGYSSFRAQMSTVRSITFHRAETLADAGASAATVAIRTTSRLAGSTHQCAGTVRTLRSSGGGWLLDGVSITCTS